jgi:CheY-like chemotaxis protein/GAF domain-containing protein
VTDRPRFLVLGNAGEGGADWLRRCGIQAEVVQVDSWSDALERLRREAFDALLADPNQPSLLDTLRTLDQAQRILDTLPDGVAVVDFDLRVRWANPVFGAWCGGNAVGRGFYEALGTPDRAEAEFCPFHTALANLPLGRSGSVEARREDGGGGETAPAAVGLPGTVTTRLTCRNNRHIDLHITPLQTYDSPGPLLIALGRDVTALVQNQQKLDALHKAGRELVALPPEMLAEMSVAERIELLKVNIRRLTRDLLHYDLIEIRLLDRATGRLEPLLQDGMMPEAAGRELLARPEGHGVTGFVAATGRSYLCPDTQADPLYIEGAAGAHSSLTVPLTIQDQVIGTFNVESPRPDAFGEDDRKFAEIFSHEVAAGLHTLELLSVEKTSAATQSLEAVSREVALPVDDILAAATSMLERYIGHDADMADKIRKILVGARSIKQVIQKVGEDLASQPPSGSKPPAPPSLKGLRVLVADKDERVRRSAHSLLGRWGCVVETARDGREALTMARLSSYDAILTDIRLPDVNGYEAYRGLREAQPQARVILMTEYGYDPTHTVVKARQDGLRHVLFKPFRVDQLLDALQGTPQAEGKGPNGEQTVSAAAGPDAARSSNS